MMWMHALASAYAARAIAARVGLGEPEKFFLMGITHDVGKVLLIKALSDMLPQEQLQQHDDIIGGIQEAHAAFGASLLETWGFTPEYVRVANAHEGTKFTEATKKEVLVVNLANKLTRKIGYSLFNDEQMDVAGLESAKLLNLESDVLEEISEEVMDLMQKNASIF